MKKIFLLGAVVVMLSACSQQTIDPADSLSKPPKTTCGGADCEEDKT